MPVEKPVVGEEFQLLTDTGVYKEHVYKTEQELERLVVAHAEEVFGKRTIYFDVKQRVVTKLQLRVTDGLLLDFRKHPIPHLWVVEYEMYSHDLVRHVIPQLRGFVGTRNRLSLPKRNFVDATRWNGRNSKMLQKQLVGFGTV